MHCLFCVLDLIKEGLVPKALEAVDDDEDADSMQGFIVPEKVSKIHVYFDPFSCQSVELVTVIVQFECSPRQLNYLAFLAY